MLAPGGHAGRSATPRQPCSVSKELQMGNQTSYALTSSHSARNQGLKASTLCVLILCTICGNCATTQQAIEAKPHRKPNMSRPLRHIAERQKTERSAGDSLPFTRSKLSSRALRGFALRRTGQSIDSQCNRLARADEQAKAGDALLTCKRSHESNAPRMDSRPRHTSSRWRCKALYLKVTGTVHRKP